MQTMNCVLVRRQILVFKATNHVVRSVKFGKTSIKSPWPESTSELYRPIMNILQRSKQFCPLLVVIALWTPNGFIGVGQLHRTCKS
jgi:hypothetical protein